MTEYIPSPELVEASSVNAWVPMDAVEDALTAAVAYRTPSGDPELVPWVEVAGLIDAIEGLLEGGESGREGDWDYAVGYALGVLAHLRREMRTGGVIRPGTGPTVSEKNHGSLLTPEQRAALAPWTQENR